MHAMLTRATLLGLSVLLAACGSVYYDTLEQFGIPKRDILVDRVEEARDAQQEAKEEFTSALEQFTSVLNYDGGDLEDMYNSVNDAYESSLAQAEQVRERIEAVEDVSEALFEEWEDELSLYSDESLRRSSENALRATRERYHQLINAMHAAESRMGPVLDTYQDQVLFLKHNLNSRAIASLRTELSRIETDIDALIRAMEGAIAESNRFLQQIEEVES